jgi:hypothetical protein
VKRKLTILAFVVATIVAALVISSSRGIKTTVFFSQPYAQTNGPMLKLTFDVTNTANRAVFLQVAAIERHSTSAWLSDTQALPADTFLTLGKVGANGNARLSFELLHEPVRTRLRVVVCPDATAVQKAQFAMHRLWANVRGQAQHKQLWIGNLAVPSYQVVTPEIP